MNVGAPISCHFQPGQPLFNEGDQSDCLYVIQKGTVAVRKRKEGGFIELAKIYSNETVGELSFFDRQPRSAQAIAVTEVEALQISFKSLDPIYKNIPQYLKTILACLADRMRKADDTIKRLQRNLSEDIKTGDDEEEGEEQPDSADDILDALAEDD